MTAITEEALSVSGILLSKVFNRGRLRGRALPRGQPRADPAAGRAGHDRAGVLRHRADLLRDHAGADLPRRRASCSPAAAAARTLTAGTLVAFTTLQARLQMPLLQLMRVSLDVQTSLALFRRIFEYLDLEPAHRRAARRRRARPRAACAARSSSATCGSATPSRASSPARPARPLRRHRRAIDGRTEPRPSRAGRSTASR